MFLKEVSKLAIIYTRDVSLRDVMKNVLFKKLSYFLIISN